MSRPRKIDKILLGHPNLAKTLFWSTSVDEAVLRSWVVNVGRRDAFQRIGHLLCEMHLRLKKIGLVSDDKYDLPMTQEELADATALTPVHVNRTLQRLRKEELIELRGGALTVLDVERLEPLSGFNPAYLHTARRVAANFNDAVAPGSVGRSMRKA